MKLHYLLFLTLTFLPSAKAQDQFNEDSQMLLSHLRSEYDTDWFIEKAKAYSLNELEQTLQSKEQKLAFWMNVYNGLIQHRLLKNPKLYDDRDKFFTEKWVDIAGVLLSFDDIEHGIIRNSRVKLGLGYVKDIFAEGWEKRLRNTEIDGRIHFALNCGAKSCPPIATFTPESLDQDLTAIARQYLNTVTEINEGILYTSPLFSWFRGDFGGKNGIKNMLIYLDVVQNACDYDIEFQDYDWTLDLGNYIDI